MSGDHLFLDTAFIQALLDRRDQYHARARSLQPRMRTAASVLVTEAILIEAANALSGGGRSAAVGFIDRCYQEQTRPGGNLVVVEVDTLLVIRGLDLYRSRSDKTWSLTDCI